MFVHRYQKAILDPLRRMSVVQKGRMGSWVELPRQAWKDWKKGKGLTTEESRHLGHIMGGLPSQFFSDIDKHFDEAESGGKPVMYHDIKDRVDKHYKAKRMAQGGTAGEEYSVRKPWESQDSDLEIHPLGAAAADSKTGQKNTGYIQHRHIHTPYFVRDSGDMSKNPLTVYHTKADQSNPSGFSVNPVPIGGSFYSPILEKEWKKQSSFFAQRSRNLGSPVEEVIHHHAEADMEKRHATGGFSAGNPSGSPHGGSMFHRRHLGGNAPYSVESDRYAQNPIWRGRMDFGMNFTKRTSQAYSNGFSEPKDALHIDNVSTELMDLPLAKEDVKFRRNFHQEVAGHAAKIALYEAARAGHSRITWGISPVRHNEIFHDINDKHSSLGPHRGYAGVNALTPGKPVVDDYTFANVLNKEEANPSLLHSLHGPIASYIDDAPGLDRGQSVSFNSMTHSANPVLPLMFHGAVDHQSAERGYPGMLGHALHDQVKHLTGVKSWPGRGIASIDGLDAEPEVHVLGDKPQYDTYNARTHGDKVKYVWLSQQVDPNDESSKVYHYMGAHLGQDQVDEHIDQHIQQVTNPFVHYIDITPEMREHILSHGGVPYDHDYSPMPGGHNPYKKTSAKKAVIVITRYL